VKRNDFVEAVAGDALHQLVVGNRVAIAQDHGGNLSVDQRHRNEAGRMPADLDVLAGCVEDLDDVLVRHQVEQRLEVDAVGQRIDHDGFVSAGDLRHAKLRIIGALAQELGINRHEWVALQAPADFSQGSGRCDQLHTLRLI
jgi:hypothetical protein